MQVESMPNEICVFNRQSVGNDLFLKKSMKAKYLENQNQMIIWTQLIVNFLVLHALQTDDSMDCSCMFDIMQFRQHACDKRNANFDRYFWHKSKVFVEGNGPLSSVKFYNKFHCFYTE